MIMYCTHEGDHQVNALICAYSCPAAVKLKCKEYKENYEKLKKLLIEKKYLDKYDLPNFPDPNVVKKQRKPRSDKGTPKPAKPTKEPVKESSKPKKEAVPAAPKESVKPKRKRRTKAEMAASRKEGAK